MRGKFKVTFQDNMEEEVDGYLDTNNKVLCRDGDGHAFDMWVSIDAVKKIELVERERQEESKEKRENERMRARTED